MSFKPVVRIVKIPRDCLSTNAEVPNIPGDKRSFSSDHLIVVALSFSTCSSIRKVLKFLIFLVKFYEFDWPANFLVMVLGLEFGMFVRVCLAGTWQWEKMKYELK